MEPLKLECEILSRDHLKVINLKDENQISFSVYNDLRYSDNIILNIDKAKQLRDCLDQFIKENSG